LQKLKHMCNSSSMCIYTVPTSFMLAFRGNTNSSQN
jgi:hypothetical protein